MDIEDRLRALESRYRKALNTAMTAKAHYQALLDEPNATPADVANARQQWEARESKKREIAARMGELEDLESGVEPSARA
jgi:hypothetical protein